MFVCLTTKFHENLHIALCRLMKKDVRLKPFVRFDLGCRRSCTGVPVKLGAKYLRYGIPVRAQLSGHRSTLGCFRKQWRKVSEATKGN